MKKILFVLNDYIYIRNFISTKILDKLSKKFNIELLINEKLKVKSRLNKRFQKKIYYFNSFKSNKLITYYHDLKITNLKKRSIFFPFRLKRLYRYDLRFYKEYFLYQKNISLLNKFFFIKILIKNIIIFSFFLVLSKFPLFNIIKYFHIRRPLNQVFLNKLKKIDPDLVLIPTSGYDADSLELINVLKKLKIKSYCVIDNWDNLSSKFIFDVHPDRIGVWGKQTMLHANKIQRINKKKISILGSARSEIFFEKRTIPHKPIYKTYILFLGSSWSWDEESVITIIDKYLNNYNDKQKKITLVYRPHPFRQRITQVNPEWKNVIIDKQLKQIIENKKNKRKIWPDLNYYPSLLQNCLFAVGGLTSMLIETSIFWKKYLAVGFDDNQSLMNQKNALKFFPHLKKIESLPNVHICKKENHFIKMFNNLILEKNYILTNKKVKNKIDLKREYFLSGNKSSFSDNLIKDLKNFS